MIERIGKIINWAIWLSYLALAVVAPLLFSTRNTELFEVPKMHFVYFGATFILVLTLIKFVLQGRIIIPKNWPLTIFAVFVVIEIFSTFTSIDKFTSVFGYPSRLNGGLLSQSAYLIIFATALVNLSKGQAKKMLLTAIIGALAVALWGIPGHFGRDPSCFVLTGRLTSDCWQKEFDPQVRIFSTLGQPNWLASYLVLILPFSAYLLLTTKRLNLKILFLLTSIILFTALLMTTSRAGLLGLALTAIIFLPFIVFSHFKTGRQNLLWLGLLLVGMMIITALFGRFLFARLGEAITKYQVPGTSNQQQEATHNPTIPQASPPNIGGTESSTIRLIVWKGAVEAFKHRPVLGFGPETFAYSYYFYRPAEHNKTTEWNFFYNKAHNELLNYLAGIGAVGTSLYVAFLVTTLAVFYKLMKASKKEAAVFLSAGFSSVVGYQTTIFFGFSTVTSQVVFYLTIALVLILANGQQSKTFKLNLPSKAKYLTGSLLVILGVVALTIPIRFYLADLLIASAKQSISGNISQALNDYNSAISLFPAKNPFYLADDAYAQAIYTTSFEDKNIKEKLAARSADLALQALNLSPNNLIVVRKVANTFFILTEEDNEYAQKALDSGTKLTKLAPTDPQSYYTLAQIQAGVDKSEEAKKTLETALSLKPDYQDAQELLQQLTFDR